MGKWAHSERIIPVELRDRIVHYAAALSGPTPDHVVCVTLSLRPSLAISEIIFSLRQIGFVALSACVVAVLLLEVQVITVFGSVHRVTIILLFSWGRTYARAQRGSFKSHNQGFFVTEVLISSKAPMARGALIS